MSSIHKMSSIKTSAKQIIYTALAIIKTQVQSNENCIKNSTILEIVGIRFDKNTTNFKMKDKNKIRDMQKSYCSVLQCELRDASAPHLVKIYEHKN